METKAKLSERLAVTPAGNWVPVANYRQFMGVGIMEDADADEGVTVQLRKATDASGTSPADHGTAVTVLATGADEDVVATAVAYANELGEDGSGNPYTHVSATISKAGSPAPAESVYGVVVRGEGRFNP